MSYQSGGGGISFSGDRITTAGLSSSGGSTYVPIGGSASAMPLPGSYPSAVEAERVNKYETSLPIRLDILAALAYILAPLSGEIYKALSTYRISK